ncbi:MAG: TAXI family TRAP transporter solute-binding subunit [Dehalococcoidales bacterium]|nr:TAXI family TRAP transporter solute-binding subunit [Dehalococcoidales bacterium]
MKKSLFTRVMLPVAVLLSLVLLMACSTPTPTATPSPTASPKPTTSTPTTSPTATPKPTTTTPVEKKTWRFYTTVEGSFAYSVGVGLTRVANKYNNNVEIVVTTGTGSTTSNYLYEKGEIDTVYSSNLALYQMYSNQGIFATTPVKYRAYQGVYLYSADQLPLIKAGRTDIKSFGDLAGKKLFPYFSSSGTHDTYELVLRSLGIWDKITDRQIGDTEAPSALTNGQIDAIGAYTIGQATLPAWVKNIDVQAKIQVLQPSDAEKAIIQKIPTIVILQVPATVFTQPVGVQSVYAFSNIYGWGFGPAEDTDRVYGITKAWFEHPDELLAINPGFVQFKNIGLQMETDTINSMSNVPVHPGVAKYLKEKGVWKDTWKIGDLYARTK